MAYKFTHATQVDGSSEPQADHLPHYHHLRLFQKARQAYLNQFSYSEQNIEGLRMFIVEVNCVYKKELFHQDRIDVKCRIDQMKNKIFTMAYVIERDSLVCAQGFTKCACIDPATRKSAPLPQAFVSSITRFEGA